MGVFCNRPMLVEIGIHISIRILHAEFLQFNDAEILQDKGKVTAAIAKAFAESEFEQYRII